jgi:hypothetical protein
MPAGPEPAMQMSQSVRELSGSSLASISMSAADLA